MNVLSLFDGISCGMVALERSGIHVDQYFASEIDKNAEAISQKNYPQIVRLGDVMNHESWKLPKIDLIFGGSPCQAFSRAGKCLNFEDPRGKLFFEFEKIYKNLREKNPDIKILFENVEMAKENRDVISERLELEPMLINSNLLSAQNRPRLYWTNISYKKPQDRGIVLKNILEDVDCRDFIQHQGILIDNKIDERARNLISNVDGEIRINQATKKGYIIAEDGDGVNLQFPTSKTRRGRVIKQKSSTLDCQCEICVFSDGVIRKLTIKELERLQTLPDGYTEGSSENIAKKAIGNGWTVDVIAHILGGLKNGNL